MLKIYLFLMNIFFCYSAAAVTIDVVLFRRFRYRTLVCIVKSFSCNFRLTVTMIRPTISPIRTTATTANIDIIIECGRRNPGRSGLRTLTIKADGQPLSSSAGSSCSKSCNKLADTGNGLAHLKVSLSNHRTVFE